MGKIAFVFAGQGAQYPGMGQELAQCSPAAAQVFQQLDALRPGTSQQCFSGTEAELKETRNTQPCMFAVELAAAAALEEKGLRADLAAGFSLGEIGALAYTGAVDLETGFHLVCRRGELMQQAAEAQPTAMAAVLKLENAAVEALCAQFPETYPVNYNCPGQVSVACAKEQLAPFSAAVKAAGGRALPLKVAGGFHSPFMASAAQGFAQVLADCQVGQPKLPLYSNKTGAVYDGDPKELLAQQIVSPVRWETIVRNMIAAGADTFIELGPGKTLCGLIQKTDPSVKTYPLSTPEGPGADPGGGGGMLTGKTALITGGARGIGAAIVETLAAQGANVAVLYAGSQEKAEALCAQCAQDHGPRPRPTSATWRTLPPPRPWWPR